MKTILTITKLVIFAIIFGLGLILIANIGYCFLTTMFSATLVFWIAVCFVMYCTVVSIMEEIK